MFIKVKVHPESKKEIVSRINDSTFEISIREKAERNMANKRVYEILKDFFAGKRIKIITGHKTQNKIFEVL